MTRVTRERLKIDRIAYPWLIARFIDKILEFPFAPAQPVLRVVERTGVIPFGISDLEKTHQAPRLFSISLQLSAVFNDNHEMLQYAMIRCVAPYAWRRSGQIAAHDWPSEGAVTRDRTNS
jgi:hypothetical protein